MQTKQFCLICVVDAQAAKRIGWLRPRIDKFDIFALTAAPFFLCCFRPEQPRLAKFTFCDADVIVICCESEVDGRLGAFVQFALDAFVLSHAILLEIARDTFQFQELLGTDRIARLFDMFPVDFLNFPPLRREFGSTVHSLALNNSVIVCEALTESRTFSQSTSTLMHCLYLQSFLFT